MSRFRFWILLHSASEASSGDSIPTNTVPKPARTITLTPFLEDIENGNPKHIYQSSEFADISVTPIPRWDLLEKNKYAQLNIQYSRGCPFDCEFCDISILFGRRVRTKTTDQVTAELDAVYATGWRGGVLIVDDNFIGNGKKLKSDILPAMIEWMDKYNHPFSFQTEASINLADDDEFKTR